MTPELKARVSIDALLVAAGWHVCNVVDANIHASVGVAIREVEGKVGSNLERTQVALVKAFSSAEGLLHG